MSNSKSKEKSKELNNFTSVGGHVWINIQLLLEIVGLIFAFLETIGLPRNTEYLLVYRQLLGQEV